MVGLEPLGKAGQTDHSARVRGEAGNLGGWLAGRVVGVGVGVSGEDGLSSLGA